jgi:muramoyltetrapeptide carboxypeptidase
VPISRRTLVAAAGATPFLALAKASYSHPTLKPKALKKGDTIAIVAPSSAAGKAEDVAQAQAAVEAIGFKVKLGAHVDDYWGYLAGTDEHRAADLNQAFQDPEVDGIFCFQGGYGAGRILDLLDYHAIRRNPKVIIGYSDITALLVGIYARANVVTFHGPIAWSDYKGFEYDNMVRVLEQASPVGALGEPTAPSGNTPFPSGATLHPGTAAGKLVGGNLTLLSSLAGSPYLPSFDGHLLFVEDIGEEPYRIDRMLNTLRLCGATKGVKGLIFGDFHAREKKPFDEPTDPARSFDMGQVLQNFTDQMGVPAFSGSWFGHIRDKYTLPLGVHAEMDADNRKLSLLESAVLS